MPPTAEDAMKDTQPAGATNTGTTSLPAPATAQPKPARRAKKAAGSIVELKAALRDATPDDRITLLKQLRAAQRQANAAALAAPADKKAAAKKAPTAKKAPAAKKKK